jgi:hypothetical protein
MTTTTSSTNLLVNNSTYLNTTKSSVFFSSKLLNYIDAIKLKINDLKEFTEIITNNNLINLDMVISNYNDCLDQIIFNVFKLSNELSLDIYKLFELVHESNMSKVCIDLDTAIRSVEFYQKVEKLVIVVFQ